MKDKSAYSAFGDAESIADLVTGKTPQPFAGELMICIMCGRQEQSRPDQNSNWRAIELNGKRVYACPREFPPDGSPAKDFRKAYLKILLCATAEKSSTGK